MRLPVSIEAGQGVSFDNVRGLHPGLRLGLEAMGYSELFPVQSSVWRELAGGLGSAHDLCVCAPTGSGKTLAYALPVLQGLLGSGQPGPLLRALVVLPTRDLAAQVSRVFEDLCPSVGLTSVLAAGKDSLSDEAALLVAPTAHGYRGRADVVVATPGRLVSHLQGTPGFTLEHLR